MVRKIGIERLEEGMHICGLAKDWDDTVVTFVNNMLVRDRKEIDVFYSYGYRAAYVIVAKAQPHLTRLNADI